MTTDNFFNARRFMKVCRKDFLEQWKTNLLRFIMMYGVLSLIMLWFEFIINSLPGMRNNNNAPIAVIFTLGIYVAGMLAASFTMEKMKRKTGRIAFLMTPATQFEKYLSRWLLCTVGFLIAYVAAFKLADWTRIAVLGIYYKKQFAALSCTQFYEAAFNGSIHDCLLATGMYFLFQSLFVLGSAIWPKNACIKTMAALVGIGVVHLIVMASIIKSSGGIKDEAIMALDFTEAGMKCTATAILYAWALFFWILAYFRFKESELINRW